MLLDTTAASRGATAALQLRRLRHGPGAVDLGPADAHRVRLVAGDAVRASCRSDHFVARRGDIDVLPAGYAESWQEHEAGESIVLTLAPEMVARSARDAGLARHAALAPQCLLRDPRLEHLLWALDAEREAGWAHGRLYADSLATAVATCLLPPHGPIESRAGLSPRQLRRVREHVDAHLAENLSLELLAGVAGLSPSHFKTLFKRSVGVPAYEYVIRQRVQRARALLLRRELPASQVALEAGFAHQSHMARCMKRVLGLTPSALLREQG